MFASGACAWLHEEIRQRCVALLCEDDCKVALHSEVRGRDQSATRLQGRVDDVAVLIVSKEPKNAWDEAAETHVPRTIGDEGNDRVRVVAQTNGSVSGDGELLLKAQAHGRHRDDKHVAPGFLRKGELEDGLLIESLGGGGEAEESGAFLSSSCEGSEEEEDNVIGTLCSREHAGEGDLDACYERGVNGEERGELRLEETVLRQHRASGGGRNGEGGGHDARRSGRREGRRRHREGERRRRRKTNGRGGGTWI